MCFLYCYLYNAFFVAVILNAALPQVQAESNNSIFVFKDVNLCKRNEYYNLDYFKCMDCNANNTNNAKLQATADKLSCKCASNTITTALYEANKRRPICANICPAFIDEPQENELNCVKPEDDTLQLNCKFQYVNAVVVQSKEVSQEPKPKTIHITWTNHRDDDNCSVCDLKYNFHYQDFCIANDLMKPYLKYNGFWQPTAMVSGHYDDLRFVTFFCLRLHNRTACNHLANLCVISNFSLEKNSPCSAFLLTQASSDAVFKYATDEQLQALEGPFLYYKKGKQTAKLLAEPLTAGVTAASYTLGNSAKKHRAAQNRLLHFFSMIYALDGTLLRMGDFKLNHVNLCRLHLYNVVDAADTNADEMMMTTTTTQQILEFAQPYKASVCKLTLENLIDLSRIYGNTNFMSLFLNFTSNNDDDNKTLMLAIPIFIENLIPENQRNQPEEWQLVKRFLLIETQARHHFGTRRSPIYEDAHKLMLYRSIRYVDKFEIYYEIHDNNRIGIPLVKLRYHTVELGGSNATLNDIYNFKFDIKFKRIGEETASRHAVNEIALPVLLLMAIAAALLHACNCRKRRTAAAANTADAAVGDCWDFACLIEFLLQLISNMANALLVCFLLHTSSNAISYYTQNTVELTLPIEKDAHSSLAITIYAALALKFIFVGIHFWRISHFDLYFIDWERPKCYDNNHFNLKNNLETSSVCSSVRTFTSSESNISAWRMFFMANEWIRLSIKQKTSTAVQGFCVLIIFKLLNKEHITHHDLTLELFIIIICYIIIHVAQLGCRLLFVNRIFGNPLQKFTDLCSLTNISVFALLETCYGYYIHGRSPHGFSDTDMASLQLQLQRESQSMCGRRGLLSDSDQRTYIIMPPKNLRTYFEKLLIPFQRSYNISQAHFQKEINSIEGSFEKTSIAYSSINRFFCAFIDHAIKDMDYIIKEKTIIEKLFNCECDKYLTENKGTFYIDNAFSFAQLFLYGNNFHIFIMEFLLVLSLYIWTMNLIATIVVVCLLNKLFQHIFLLWVRQNVATKTLIDKRFLM